MMNIPRTMLVIAALLLTGNTAAAFEPQPLKDISAAAHDFVASQLDTTLRNTVTVGHLDARLRLQRCKAPLTADFLSGNQPRGRSTVSVSCSGPKPWIIHVPVNVDSYASVVVALRAVPRKRVIDGNDLRMEEREISTLSQGYFTDLSEVRDRLSRRQIQAGTVVSPLDVAAQKMIHKGQKVSIMAQGGGISVHMKGKALEDGEKGEPITVENLSSGRKIGAIVVSPGVVKVPM